MNWTIIDDVRGQKIEHHSSPRSAQYALMILTAHELKNGRKPAYRIDPPIELRPIEELNLPSWAIPVLKKAEIERKVSEQHKVNGPLVAALEEHLKES